MMQLPGTNFHDLNLDWLLQQMKTCLAQWATTQDDWHELQANNTEFKEYMTGQWEGFREFVLNYLHNLPLTEEVSAKIDAMAADGTLLELITHDDGEGSALSDVAGQWLAAHITQETGYVIDDSLTVEGAAADAKATGNRLSNMEMFIQSSTLGSGTATSANKRLLLNYYSPLESGLHISDLYLLANSLDTTTDVKIELANKTNTGYTVYESKTVSLAQETTSDEIVLVADIDKITNGITYIFITCSASAKFRVSSSQGKTMYVGDDLVNDSFTVRSVANYEIAFTLYYNMTIQSVEDQIIKNGVPRVFRVGSTREYTSILEAVIEAEKYENSIVYVDPGTYDMVQEFKTKYGNTYFTSESYTSQTNFRGCPLTNGIHIIGYTGAVITGGLESTDAELAKTWWSIFNSGDDANGKNGFGFTLENLTIKSTSQYLRYLVHDENGNTDYDYINKYLNCDFIVYSGNAKRAIGGGLGKHACIVFDNCSLNAQAYEATTRGINYHNNADSGSLSKVIIKNCYIPNGTVGITWYGSTPATEKSIMYVSNCYLQNQPIKQAETQESTNENVDIVAWNNTIAA